MATAQAYELAGSDSFVEDSSSCSSSEDSSASGAEDEPVEGARQKGILDISWSEFSRWPEDVIDEAAAEAKGPIRTLKISHNVLKEIPHVSEMLLLLSLSLSLSLLLLVLVLLLLFLMW